MHKLLERQLKRLFESPDAVPEAVSELARVVDEAYRQADADRKLLERSLDLTSQELLEANAELRRDRAALEQRVRLRTVELLQANSSLEREIAERRVAESALRTSEKRYQTLAEQSPAGILHFDGRGRCLYVNRRLCEMAGLSPSEALVEGWTGALHPEDRERVIASWQQAISTRVSVYSSEFRFRRADGQVFWVVGQAVALAGEDGSSGYVATVTDITERKAAEEAIRKSEARYRSLFEGSRDAIYVSTPEGQLLDINPAGVELLGYSAKRELLAVDLTRDVYQRAEDRARLLERVRETGFVRDLELGIRRRDGKLLTVLATTTAMRDETGRMVALMGILRDVTRQRVLERQLWQAQKMEAIGRLAGGVAHDFNNLLTAIIGYSDLIRMSLSPEDPVYRQVDEIRQAGKRGADLTRQLLAFSRRQVLRPRVMHLNQTVADMENLLRRIIGEDIELETRLDAGLGAVRADPSQIEQVVLNLAINGRDAMPHGGKLRIETANVDIGSETPQPLIGLPPGPYVVLVVEDTGTGIPEEIRDQIFEPFFTTKEGGAGTGLGLATVYGVVQQSGGRITVRAGRGGGTAFAVYLPRVEAVPERPLAPAAAAPGLPGGRETVLLVEDEPAVRSFLGQFLEHQGYRVLTAADGEEAQRVAGEHPEEIDVLLSDVVMPRLDGIELARCLLQANPDLKVLLMSGYAGRTPGLAENAQPGEGAAFLHKPFSTEELARKLREILETDSELAAS